jgi:hypothetical protein
MSEKTQHTVASLREKMLHRYSDGLEHKHNKIRHAYRKHCRSHPINPDVRFNEDLNAEPSTGQMREFKLKKTRKRLDKGRIH